MTNPTIDLRSEKFALRPRVNLQVRAGQSTVGTAVLASLHPRLQNMKLQKIRVLLLVVASLAWWALDSAAAQDKPEIVSATILALENKWNAAYKRGDIATMESLLADDFIITVEDGSTLSKFGYIAHNGDSTLHVELTEMSDLKVRTHGSTVVVIGAYHEKGLSKGKPYEYRDRFTDVWMKTNGRWQVVASHYSIPVSQ